jgi:predicted nucleic acid-binding Zn ribbon protein
MKMLNKITDGQTTVVLPHCFSMIYPFMTCKFHHCKEVFFEPYHMFSIDLVLYWQCPNCGNAFQVLEFTVKDEQQFCPYCSQPFKLEGKEFVRDGPQFSARQSAGFQSPFGGFGQRKSTAPEASAGNMPFLPMLLSMSL